MGFGSVVLLKAGIPSNLMLLYQTTGCAGSSRNTLAKVVFLAKFRMERGVWLKGNGWRRQNLRKDVEGNHRGGAEDTVFGGQCSVSGRAGSGI
jgi:hypothetical protein